MLSGVWRRIVIIGLLAFFSSSVFAEVDHFWLLQEYGIEKRALEDGALLKEFAPLTRPLAFAVQADEKKIWAVADSFLVSFDETGALISNTPLNNINQNVHLISRPDGGVWLFHKNSRYSFDENGSLVNQTDLKNRGNQINDVIFDSKRKVIWLTTFTSVISIDENDNVEQYDLDSGEKVDGLTVTSSGNIALIVTTAHPIIRVYSSDFTLKSELSLDTINQTPENITQLDDSRYWIAGKQHILLVDIAEGILVNHELNSEIGQGPGEAHIITNKDDESAWYILGKNLLHINQIGEVLERINRTVNNVDIKPKNNSPQKIKISPIKQRATLADSIFSSTDYVFHVPSILFEFALNIDRNNETSELKSISIFSNGKEYSSDIIKANTTGDYTYRYVNINLTSDKRLYCSIEDQNSSNEADTTDVFNCLLIYSGHDKVSQISKPLADELLTYEIWFTNENNEISEHSLVEVFIDNTPPTLNFDLVNFSLDINPILEDIDISRNTYSGSFTVTGLPGSVDPSETLYISYYPGFNEQDTWTSGRIIKSNPDGSFSYTAPLTFSLSSYEYYKIGTNILIGAKDEYENYARPRSFRLGNEINLELSDSNEFPNYMYYSSQFWQIRQAKFDITGTYSPMENGRITATYWSNGIKKTANAILLDNNTFRIEDISFDEPESLSLYKRKVIIDAAGDNDSYGRYVMYFNLDTMPPEAPTYEKTGTSYSKEKGAAFVYWYDLEPFTTITIFNRTTNSSTEVTVSSIGSGSTWVTAQPGDNLEIYLTDHAGYKSDTLYTRVSYHIGFTVTYPTSDTWLSDNTTNINGTLSETPTSAYKIKIGDYVSDSFNTKSFSLKNVTLDINPNYDSTYGFAAKIPITIISDDNGYGKIEQILHFDMVPPKQPDSNYISVQFTSEDIAKVTGQIKSVEFYSSVTLTNTRTGETVQTQSSNFGEFSVDIHATHGDVLSITSTDRANNESEATLINAGYIINIQLTKPTDGETVYTQNVIVSGSHDGPAETTIYANGAHFTVNNNQFGEPTEIDPATGVINVIARGPNNGYGTKSVHVIYQVPSPNADLIKLTFSNDKVVTVSGAPGAAVPDGKVAVTNPSYAETTTANTAHDGSFTTTLTGIGGDILTLTAIDKNNLESKPISIKAGYEASLTIDSPTTGTVVGPHNLTVTGSHSGPVNSRIYVNGVSATVTDSNFTATNVPVDSSGFILARLYAEDGAYGSSIITVQVDAIAPDAPNVDLITTSLSAGDNLYLVGKPGSVESNATLTITNLSDDTTTSATVNSDGSFNVYITGQNGDELSLVAVDTVGNESSPSTLQVGTEASIIIDTPISNASVNSGFVTVTGRHSGPINSGIVVNGVIAAVTEDHFVANNVPVSSDGTITATLAALDGSYGSAQISVTNLGTTAPLLLTPSATEGVAPHTVNFDWRMSTTDVPASFSIDYNGDGVFDQAGTDITMALEHEYATAAISKVTLQMTMTDGTVKTAKTVVVTHSPEYIDAIFLSLWNGMNNALLANEPNIALNYLNLAAQRNFYVTFHVIAPNMQEVVDSYHQPARGDINENYLEYLVARSINGSNQIFAIYSIKDRQGIWRIDSM